jgi:hypothetical protein
MPAIQFEYYKIGHLYRVFSGETCMFASGANPYGNYVVRIKHGSVALCVGSVTNHQNYRYGLFLATNMQGQSEEFACGDWEEDAMWLEEMTT